MTFLSTITAHQHLETSFPVYTHPPLILLLLLLFKMFHLITTICFLYYLCSLSSAFVFKWSSLHQVISPQSKRQSLISQIEINRCSYVVIQLTKRKFVLVSIFLPFRQFYSNCPVLHYATQFPFIQSAISSDYRVTTKCERTNLHSEQHERSCTVSNVILDEQIWSSCYKFYFEFAIENLVHNIVYTVRRIHC